MLKRKISSEKKYQAGTKNEKNRECWIKSALGKLAPGTRILDAGAGELSNKPFCSHLNYVSQDFCRYDGKGDNSALQTQEWDNSKIEIVSDICDIPQPDESFDAILCTEVFEHLPDPISALQEFKRLLKQGGQLIITAPFCSLSHFTPYHFSSGFNRYFYYHHYEKLGFKVKELQTNGNFFEYLAQELRRIPTISERYTSLYPSFLEKKSLTLILKMLGKFSKNDNGSDELLCFGYHVIGEKK